jgi:hypothetical protein
MRTNVTAQPSPASRLSGRRMGRARPAGDAGLQAAKLRAQVARRRSSASQVRAPGALASADRSPAAQGARAASRLAGLAGSRKANSAKAPGPGLDGSPSASRAAGLPGSPGRSRSESPAAGLPGSPGRNPSANLAAGSPGSPRAISARRPGRVGSPSASLAAASPGRLKAGSARRPGPGQCESLLANRAESSPASPGRSPLASPPASSPPGRSGARRATTITLLSVTPRHVR